MPVSKKYWNNLSTSRRLAFLKLSSQRPRKSSLIKRLNYFLFLDDPDDELHISDAWWFYGILGGALLLTFVVWVFTKF